jgi:hypothetical protein
MSKKVTLIKQCGRPDCNDPKCPYIMVENNRTFKRYVKEFDKRSKYNMFTLIGVVICILFFCTFTFAVFSVLLGL